MELFIVLSLALLGNAAESPDSLVLPGIEDVHVTKVTIESAEFYMRIRTHGFPTRAWFEWGETTAYTDTTSVSQHTPSAEPWFVRAALSKLTRGKIYHFRAVAENPAGATFSTDHRFITSPPDIVTLLPDGITSNGARLRARCDTDGEPASVFFSVGPESTYTAFTTPAQDFAHSQSPVEIESVLDDLVPSTTYYIRAYARNTDMPDILVQGNLQILTTRADSDAAGFLVPLAFEGVSKREAVVHFGVHTSASRCVDEALGEQELPPPPPSDDEIVLARFTGRCLGSGTSIDLRRFRSDLQSDTFTVALQAGVNSIPIRISWPRLDTIYRAAQLLLGSGTIDMTVDTTVTIDRPGIDVFTIVATGPRPHRHLPLAVTLPSEGIVQGRILAAALVNPDGLPTLAWIEWETSDSLAGTTQPVFLGDSIKMLRLRDTLAGAGAGTRLRYRAVARNPMGAAFGGFREATSPEITRIEELSPRSGDFVLYQNRPNPFNSETIISYELLSPERVTLELFDLLGRRVAILADGAEMPGRRSVPVTSADLSSGIYCYRLRAGNYSQIRMMVLLK